jgi:hypothetical protein
VSSSSKLSRTLTQLFGLFLGIAIAIWILRGLGILTFIPGGIILLLFAIAIAIAILNHLQKIWWRL